MYVSRIDIKIVSKILGHASVTSTEIYTDVLDTWMKQEMEKFKIELSIIFVCNLPAKSDHSDEI
jgi:integrase